MRTTVSPGATRSTRNVRRRVIHCGARWTTHHTSFSSLLPPFASVTASSPVFASGATFSVTPSSSFIATFLTSSATHASGSAQPSSARMRTAARE